MASAFPPSPHHDTTEDILIRMLGEVPNQGASIFALVAFFSVTVALLVVTIRTRSWFMLTAVLTGALEMGGFVARTVMISSPTSNQLVAMQCLLIISPVLLAIVEYICVGKLVQKSEAGRASRGMRWQARLFTASDFVCLFLQGGGGALLAQAETNPKAADNGRLLLLAGLALQLVFFSMFTVVTIIVQNKPKYGYKGNTQYARVFHCLYATIFLLFVRNIFRVIEFVQGWRGYLATHEVFFYVFDFVPVFLTLVLFTVWHYGLYLQPDAMVAAAPMTASSSACSLIEDGKGQIAMKGVALGQPVAMATAAQLLQVRPAEPLEAVTVHGMQVR